MSCERMPFVPAGPDDELMLLHSSHAPETHSLHTHDFYEILYVIRGQALHRINGASLVMEEGSLVLLRPDDAHDYRAFDPYNFECISVGIARALAAQAFHWLCIPQESFDSPILPPSAQLHGAFDQEMRRKFLELETAEPGVVQRRRFRSLLPALLMTLLEPQNEENTVMPDWLAAVLEKLDEPDCFIEGLPALLRLTPYTQEHLTRSFRKYVRMSPTAYINQIRLGYAAELISAARFSPQQAARRAGFGNISHFYHLFHQQYGCSPLQFPQQYRANPGKEKAGV